MRPPEGVRTPSEEPTRRPTLLCNLAFKFGLNISTAPSEAVVNRSRYRHLAISATDVPVGASASRAWVERRTTTSIRVDQ